jgi:hypothetical protein
MKVLNSDLLPEHYEPVSEPSFKGAGNRNVLELEELCERYKELVHQLRVREVELCRITGTEII